MGTLFHFLFRWFRRVSNEQQKKERIKFIFNDFLSFHQTSFFIDIRCSSKYIDLVFIAYQNKAKTKASKLSKCPWMKFPSLNLSSRKQSWSHLAVVVKKQKKIYIIISESCFSITSIFFYKYTWESFEAMTYEKKEIRTNFMNKTNKVWKNNAKKIQQVITGTFSISITFQDLRWKLVSQCMCSV